jgi:hypothetical protein
VKAGLKRLRLEPIKDALESVVGRNAVGQGEVLLEPGVAEFAEHFDLLPVIAAADDGANGDDNDVDQQMASAPLDARVLELGEMLPDR